MHISWVLVLFLKKERKIMLMHPLTLINGFPSPTKELQLLWLFFFQIIIVLQKRSSPCWVCESPALCHKPPREAFE